MFSDRIDAAHQLAKKLSTFRPQPSVLLGLARGGVVISATIARALQIQGDVLVVKKIVSPGNSELAIGAVAPGGVSYVDEALARTVGADDAYMRTQISELHDQIQQKTLLYRNGATPVSVKGKNIVLTDDGAATGATMRAAVLWAKKERAGRIIVALPVAPPDIAQLLRTVADDLIVLEEPLAFSAVSQWYTRFPQVSDEDVVKLLV